MRPRIVFVVMSAVHKATAVAQLARALAPHTVLVHHDFSQTPDFVVAEPNVVFVPEPKRTGWAVWGFAEGIFHALRHATQHLQFDYLQVLTPTCLPIKSMAAFERHVMAEGADAHYAWVDVLSDPDAFMSIGYRAFADENTLLFRVLGRMTLIYFGGSPHRRDVANVQLRTGGNTGADGRLLLRARLARAVMRLARDGKLGDKALTPTFKPFYGSTWFGARRHVIAWMLQRFDQPDTQRLFRGKRIADEFLIPTLLKEGGFRSGPANHFIMTFHEAHPAWLADQDFDKLAGAPAFFARKFVDDPSSPIRLRVLRELVGSTEQETSAPVNAAVLS